MLKRLRHILWIFTFGCLNTKGQSLLYDTLNARLERQEYSFIIIPPASYNELSKRFDLSKIKDTDSFSLRLWTGSMFGYSLMTFENKNGTWYSHKYEYYSDTSIKEIKLSPKISTSDFIKRLSVLNFESFISQREIKNFQDNVDDGTWYTLEIIKGKTYKVIQYHSPESFSDNDNIKFATFLKLFYKQFN